MQRKWKISRKKKNNDERQGDKPTRRGRRSKKAKCKGIWATFSVSYPDTKGARDYTLSSYFFIRSVYTTFPFEAGMIPTIYKHFYSINASLLKPNIIFVVAAAAFQHIITIKADVNAIQTSIQLRYFSTAALTKLGVQTTVATHSLPLIVSSHSSS